MYHGIINVYKEPGYTSHDVVARLRGILKQKKIGHTGTLDPAAEGVLPVCLGMGTRLCDMLADRTKTYEAVLLLGCSTDTQDTTGTILTENREKALALDPETAEKVILGFKGDYDQIPPMYSKGTYIRTLCDDIGRELGTGGCMEHLLRTRVDRFLVEDSLKLDEIEQLRDMDGLEEKIYTVEEALEAYPAVYTLPEGDKNLKNGNPCFRQQLDLLRDGAPEIWEDGDRFRFYNSEGRFKGVYQYQEEKHWWKPWKMFDLDPDTFKGAARP